MCGTNTVKKYNAEIHSQTAIEAVLTLLRRYQFSSTDIKRVDVEIFDVAHNIIGGGEEGDKTIVSTKEQADHSLPYMFAVAILDGRVMPEQYEQERFGARMCRHFSAKSRSSRASSSPNASRTRCLVA